MGNRKLASSLFNGRWLPTSGANQMLPLCGVYFDLGTEWHWASQLTLLTADGSPRTRTACCSSMLPFFTFRKRYRLGCGLLEKAIKMHSRRKGWSFELLWHLYKPLRRPATTYDVTLTHFYRALGHDLRQWELWSDFVDDFPAKLFRLSGVSRNSLRSDPAFLKPFFQWICAERERRLFSHTTIGVRDLLESAAKVERRQTSVAKKIARSANDPQRKNLEEKIRKTFPELAEIQPTGPA